jgi:hypothetical protein
MENTRCDYYVLRYRTAEAFPTLCDAWKAAKTIIGKVTKLNDSLLGQHPKCVNLIGDFDQRRHEEVRSPKTDEEFGVLVDYLCELASGLPEPRPMFEAGFIVPLYYQLASDHARIAIVRQGDEFAVILTARFRTDPSWLSAWLSRQFGNATTYEDSCAQADDVDQELAMSIIRMI